MENCIQAAIKFFDSPVCAGLTFGELRNLLNGVLELTLAELGNVTQLVDVAKGEHPGHLAACLPLVREVIGALLQDEAPLRAAEAADDVGEAGGE